MTTAQLLQKKLEQKYEVNNNYDDTVIIIIIII